MKVLSFCNFFSIPLASTNESQFLLSFLSFFLLLISCYCHHFPCLPNSLKIISLTFLPYRICRETNTR